MAAITHIEYSYLAHTKIVLHALRHAQHPVVGVLIGRFDDHSLSVVDVVPLFHSTILAPMLEMSLTLVEAHVAAMSGEVAIAGLYYGPATLSQRTVSPLIASIIDHLTTIEPRSQLIMVR